LNLPGQGLPMRGLVLRGGLTGAGGNLILTLGTSGDEKHYRGGK